MHVWKIWWMCVFESPFHFHPLHTAYTHVHAYTRRPKMSSVARSCSSPLIRSFDFHSCVMLFLVQSSETEECVHFISLFIMVAYAMATYTLHIPSTLQTDTYTLILHPYNNLSIQFLQAPWCVRDKWSLKCIIHCAHNTHFPPRFHLAFKFPIFVRLLSLFLTNRFHFHRPECACFRFRTLLYAREALEAFAWQMVENGRGWSALRT